METTETTKALTPKEKRIAKLIADTEAKLKKDIADIENEEKVKEARKELEKKIKDEKVNLEFTHKEYIKDFEKEYGVKYFLVSNSVDANTPEKLEKLKLEEKCKIAEVEYNSDNQLKYRMNDTKDAIIGAKGEPITSIIKINVNGKKETLGVRSFFQHLKPEATKEELDKLYPKKNVKTK